MNLSLKQRTKPRRLRQLFITLAFAIGSCSTKGTGAGVAYLHGNQIAYAYDNLQISWIVVTDINLTSRAINTGSFDSSGGWVEAQIPAPGLDPLIKQRGRDLLIGGTMESLDKGRLFFLSLRNEDVGGPYMTVRQLDVEMPRCKSLDDVGLEVARFLNSEEIQKVLRQSAEKVGSHFQWVPD